MTAIVWELVLLHQRSRGTSSALTQADRTSSIGLRFWSGMPLPFASLRVRGTAEAAVATWARRIDPSARTERGPRDDLLLALDSCGLELVALLPADQLGQACGLPSERESEARHRRVADKIHLGMIFVARLVIVLFDVLLFLFKAPGLGMSLVLHALIDGEGWNA